MSNKDNELVENPTMTQNKELIEKVAKKLKRRRGKLLQSWHNKYILAKFEDCSKKELEEIVHNYHAAMRLHYEYDCNEQSALQNEQAISNAESSKLDHIPDTSKMVDPQDELEELAKIEQKCLKMLPMFTEAKDAEIKALKETIIGLSKKDEQIRILREGLEFYYGGTKEDYHAWDKKMRQDCGVMASIALAAADKLNKQE